MIDKNMSFAYEKYFDMVYRICFMYFRGNAADTEDAVSETFLKYIQYEFDFESAQHEKAWLIVTAQNVCKSMLRRVFRKNVSLDSVVEQACEFKVSEVMDEILKLPQKEKMAVYLHYYEDMSGAEIAKILGCREATVFSLLHRARKKLKKALGE